MTRYDCPREHVRLFVSTCGITKSSNVTPVDDYKKVRSPLNLANHNNVDTPRHNNMNFFRFESFVDSCAATDLFGYECPDPKCIYVVCCMNVISNHCVIINFHKCTK